MFSKKPIIGKYSLHDSENVEKGIELNMFRDENGEMCSFRCPNKGCGRTVKVGYPICPFCEQKLKWKYPFLKMNVD